MINSWLFFKDKRHKTANSFYLSVIQAIMERNLDVFHKNISNPEVWGLVFRQKLPAFSNFYKIYLLKDVTRIWYSFLSRNCLSNSELRFNNGLPSTIYEMKIYELVTYLKFTVNNPKHQLFNPPMIHIKNSPATLYQNESALR